MYRFKNDKCPKFTEFFSKWYQMSGEHYIFCKDLDWMDANEVAQIVATLEGKGDSATIIVSKDGAKACRTLATSGAKLIVIPPGVATINVKMSLRIGELQYKEIIIQKKPKDSDSERVNFIKTTDSVMIALAETVVAACKALEAPTDSSNDAH